MSLKQIGTLVIGGGGYIGSNVVPILLKNGREVTVLGRDVRPKYAMPLGVTYIQGDFSQKNLISNLLEENQEVIHLAYASIPNTSFDNPLADLLDNLPPAVHLFSEAARLGVKLLLVSSGGTVYGEATSIPINEMHPTMPISPYGVTKLTLENYAYLFGKIHGLRYVCVRPSNAYGPGQRPFSGQGFIATAIGSVISGSPITIFGARGAVRDYIYIDDLAEGIVRALLDGCDGETYNIGSGIGLSNGDIIEILRPLIHPLGLELFVNYQPERPFDVRANCLDSAKIMMDTGWKSSVGFEVGLKRTIDSMLV
jgi:UDP-glucose 4-epimerase